MNRAATKTQDAQLHMPGMPVSVRLKHNASPHNVWPGQEVLYLGRASGGPRYGARGVVVRTLGRRVVVNMGHLGTWHIPYYYLTVPLRAS